MHPRFRFPIHASALLIFFVVRNQLLAISHRQLALSQSATPSKRFFQFLQLSTLGQLREHLTPLNISHTVEWARLFTRVAVL